MSKYKRLPHFNLFGLPIGVIVVVILNSIYFLAYCQDEKIAQSIDSDALVLLQKGTESYYKTNFDQAIEILSRAISLEPNAEALYQAYIHRGSALGYLWQKEEALKDFESALRINSMDPFLYYMRAVTVFATQNEFDRAIEDLNHALQLHPNPSLTLSIYLTRSDYHAQKKDFNLARDDLNLASRLDPHKAGINAYYLNQYELAITILGQIITHKPDPKTFYSALVHRGAALGYLRQKDKALEDFENALQINNQDSFLYYMRAVTVFATQKEFDRAIGDLNHALQLHPNPSLTLSIYLTRSDYHARKKEFNLARDDLNQALRLDPHNNAIYATMNNLAILYSAEGDILKRKGQYDQAVEYYSEAILLNSQNHRPFSGRAFARLLKGQEQEAISDLQYACQLGHQNACHILEILQK